MWAKRIWSRCISDDQQVFDEEEGNWHLHLNGSRTLLHRSAEARGGSLDVDFLNTWFLYHEILGAFSQPHKHKYTGISSLDLLQGDDVDKTVVRQTLLWLWDNRERYADSGIDYWLTRLFD